MTDFLEQVVAERRAEVAAAQSLSGEMKLLDPLPDNMWTAAEQRQPPASNLARRFTGSDLWRMFTYARAPLAKGDAFTALLWARRQEGQLAVIAEVKRMSPALGLLASDLDPGVQAQLYRDSGASAISVLTEPRHWGGSLADLAAVRQAVPDLPILCKDVIVSEHQIIEARNLGADAVLLIAEALNDVELRAFLARARRLNMGALVEAHEPVAFGRAVASGALVVGANARDLRRPQDIDQGRARQLHTFVREDQIFVAESGIATVDDARMLPSRVDAVLVGTALVRASDPAPLIRGLSAVRRTGEYARTTTTTRVTPR